MATQHHIVAGTGRDVVRAADTEGHRPDQTQRDRLIGEPVRIFSRRSDHAAVADHHVVAVAGDNYVTALAAYDEVGAGPRRDRVSAAIRKVGRGNHVDVGRICIGTQPGQRAFGPDVVNVAVVAEDEIIRIGHRRHLAVVRCNRVGTRAAEDDVTAHTRSDAVRTAHARPERLDPAKGQRLAAEIRRVRDRRRDQGAVAKHDVAARSSVDEVVSLAADHNIGTRARRNVVGSADGKVGRGNHVDICGAAIAHHVVDVAVVTKHDVVARAGRDLVSRAATKDDIVAVTGSYRVGATVSDIARLHLGDEKGGRVEPCGAVVADDDVVTIAGGNLVLAHAAEGDVVAGTDQYGVVAARVWNGGGNKREPAGRIEFGATVIPHDHVARDVAGGNRTRVNPVRTAATEDHVGTDAGIDVVIAAVGRVAGFNHAQDGGGIKVRKTVVANDHVRAGTGGDAIVRAAAEHDVVTVRCVDRINTRVPGARGVDFDQDVGRDIETRGAVVADDDVVAAARGNRVIAHAAKRHVVAAADEDDVAAADGGIGGEDAREEACGIELGAAVVAHDDVARDVAQRLGAGNHIVAPAAGDHDIGALAGENAVVAAVVRGVGFDDAQDTGSIEGRAAVVADDDIIATERDDEVVEAAAKNDVVALARIDHVVVSDPAHQPARTCHLLRHDGLDRDEAIGDGIKERAAVVAHDDVIARATGDEIAEAAAEDHAAAVASRQHIGCGIAGRGGEDFEQPAVGGVKFRRAVVADQDVRLIVAASEDRIAAHPTEGDVGTLAGGEDVVAAQIRGGRVDLRNDADGEQRLTIVADEDVVRHVRRRGIEHVIAEPAKQQVAPREAVDAVVAADIGESRRDEAEGALDAIGLVAGPTLAKHRDGSRTIVVSDQAAVAEDDVVRMAAGDRVIVLAAKDEQRTG